VAATVWMSGDRQSGRRYASMRVRVVWYCLGVCEVSDIIGANAVSMRRIEGFACAMDRWHWGRKKRVDWLVGAGVALRFRKMDMASHRSPGSVGIIAFRGGGRVVSVGAVGGVGRLCRSVLVCAGVADESQMMVGTNLAERERERENLSLPLSRSGCVRFGWADSGGWLVPGEATGRGWAVGVVFGDSCRVLRRGGSGVRQGAGEVPFP